MRLRDAVPVSLAREGESPMGPARLYNLLTVISPLILLATLGLTLLVGPLWVLVGVPAAMLAYLTQFQQRCGACGLRIGAMPTALNAGSGPLVAPRHCTGCGAPL
jgi:hypothetical protein